MNNHPPDRRLDPPEPTDEELRRDKLQDEYERAREAEEEEERRDKGAGTPPISDEEAAEAYRLSQTTDMIYREIAETVGISESAVGRIARREGRFGQMQAIAEVMLELEEERQNE